MNSNNDSEHRSLHRRVADRVLGRTLRVLAKSLNYTYLPINHLYGTWVGRVLWWFNTDAKRVAKANVRIAFPELNEQQQSSLVKQSLAELGKTITELGPLWCGSKRRVERLVAETRGESLIRETQDQGRGVIVLAPHFGAWELAGLYLSVHYSITSLYRPPRLTTIEGFTRGARERFGARLVPTNVSGVRALCRSLRDGNLVGILPDQDPGDSGGVFAPFFGHDARTMVLVSRLAAKTNGAVVFCVAERLSAGKGYRMHFIPADPDIGSADEYKAASALNKDIESIININPAQYQWAYKRYRARVNGQLNPYEQAPAERLPSDQTVPYRRAA